MLGLGVGGLLIAIAAVAMYLIKKRLKTNRPGLVAAYLWLAWTLALLGGAVAAPTSGRPAMGITALGAGVISVIMWLVLIVDLVDRRPSWSAIAMVAALPWFMHWTGGQLGRVYAVMLQVFTNLGHVVLSGIGA